MSRKRLRGDPPIDVIQGDLTKDSAKLEWWYFNIHVRNGNGKEVSAFSSFFRQRIDGHGVSAASMYAISDLEATRYLCDTVFDPSAYSKMENMLTPEGRGRPLNDVERNMLDWIRQKRLPYPSRVIENSNNVTSPGGRLRFDMGDHLLEVIDRVHSAPEDAPALTYHLKMKSPDGHGMDLMVTPQQQAVLHGDTGVVNSLEYYYIPRCKVSGTIIIDNVETAVEGEGWYDREYGGNVDRNSSNALDGWVWFSLQLDDGEYSLFSIHDADTKERKDHVSVFTRADCDRLVSHAAIVKSENEWTSMSTLLSYPQDWTIDDDTVGAHFEIHCAFPHQELPTILVDGGAFYEGRVSVTGTLRGKAVSGRGYLEYKQIISETGTEHSLKRLSERVKQSLQEVYSDMHTDEWIRTNVAGRHYVEGGTPPARVCEALFKPIRQLIDRGGKSWRSLLLTTSISALKKEYFDSRRYIIIPELMHVGSLVIDDIQDDSTIRRGGPCVHLEVGVATAINAGTATYFMAPRLAGVDELSAEQERRVYRLYFDCLRAGHAGQGLDILGLHYLLPAAIETGNVDEILRCLEAIHVYKTGGAAGSVMMIACVIANATEDQIQAMGNLGKSIGLAFQIVDDALNLRGFDGDLKEVGEDIRDGKITYPILKALPKLPRDKREYIGDVLRRKTSDRTVIQSVIQLLESVGAIDDCLSDARTLIDDAWASVDRTIHDSMAKLLMRSFLAFLVDRRR